MIIRTKSGIFQMRNEELGMSDERSALLEYLGVKKDTSGLQKVKNDVELIASVPFRLTDENLSDNSYPWTFSTFDLDRYDERIDPMGWDFSQFAKNPVIEWSHRYDIPAIGKAKNIYVDENGLHGVIEFNDKSYDPFGWAIGERVKAGVIRAGSVGFRVMEIEIPSKDDRQDGTDLIFRKQELLEFSICNVPANPFALAKISNEGLGMRNEELGMRNIKGDHAPQLWECLINNF